MTRYPTGFGRYLCGARLPPGPGGRGRRRLARGQGSRGQPLLENVFARYLPNRVVAAAPEGAPIGGLPLHANAGRWAAGRPPTCAAATSVRRRDDPGGARPPARGCIIRADAGGGFLRTGCGPGPLEPALDNPSEGNAPERRTIGAAPPRGAVFFGRHRQRRADGAPKGLTIEGLLVRLAVRAIHRVGTIAGSRPRRPIRRPRSTKVTRSKIVRPMGGG